jgi:hypothetical protein
MHLIKRFLIGVPFVFHFFGRGEGGCSPSHFWKDFGDCDLVPCVLLEVPNDVANDVHQFFLLEIATSVKLTNLTPTSIFFLANWCQISPFAREVHHNMSFCNVTWIRPLNKFILYYSLRLGHFPHDKMNIYFFKKLISFKIPTYGFHIFIKKRFNII